MNVLNICMQKPVKQSKNHICALKLLVYVEIMFVEERGRQQILGLNEMRWATQSEQITYRSNRYRTHTHSSWVEYYLCTTRALPCVMFIQRNRQLDAIQTWATRRIPIFNRNADEINRATTEMFHSDHAYSTVYEIRIIYINQIR